jgi:hypothetical protein
VDFIWDIINYHLSVADGKEDLLVLRDEVKMEIRVQQ